MSFVYIIEASSGLVKVGYSTQDPKGVIAAHAQLIHVAGAHVVRQVVRACGNASALERALIERLSKQSIGITREWFSGVNVDDLVRFVDDWLDTRATSQSESESHTCSLITWTGWRTA